MQILKTGSTGAEVALLQLSLRRAQYGAPAPDGVFGGATKSALQTFQRSHGLTPDGIFGAETERVLAPWLRGYAVHMVRPGDTLFSLAERYDASLGAIETANPALDPFALRPGQRIPVPLPFSVVPTDIPWCSALMDCAVDGLMHRYPQLRAESIGRSALSRPIWALTAGDGLRRVLYSAAHHANEWITTPLLMKYLETLLRAAAAGETVFGYPAEDILFRAALTLVPLVDPDGVDLVTGALPEGEAKERTAAIAAAFPAIPYPDGWKANIAGIDLNLQYPAGWDTARAIKFAQGYDRPAPRDFVGEAPLTAPEAAALAARMADFPHTALKGLMAIPPVSEFPGENCRYFAEMRNLFVDIRAKKYDNVSMECLSMGMSDDFADAIAEGSTMVRIGTAIFGKRNYNI